MKIPRHLKGITLAENLCKYWEYRIVHQQGSHIILDTHSPSHQRISIPNHNPLRVGTLNSILRSVSTHKQVSKQEILDTLN
jgi:predicted RNA binding protein YcfA (HicA-like mRNA interferase family)